MSINERLVAWLKRIAQTDRTVLDLMLAAVLIGLIGAVVFGMPAHGQTPCPATPACEPTSQPDRNLCGPELRGRTSTGEWSAFWWKDGTRWCGYSWAGLYKFSPSPAQIMQIVDAVRAAPGPAAIASAIQRYSVVPAPGSQDEYDFKTLRFAACKALVASPPQAGMTITDTCAAPPAPTVAPAYMVSVPSAYAATQQPDGTWRRSITVLATRPAVGQACDCAAITILQFGARYCAVTLPGVSTPTVAACTARK